MSNSLLGGTLKGDFKNWIDRYGKEVKVGDRVVPATALRKILKSARPQEGDLREAVKGFRDGGKIVGRDRNKVLIETSYGTFFVPDNMVMAD